MSTRYTSQPKGRKRLVFKDVALEYKVRVCLKCRKEFGSIGMRICPDCTTENERVSKKGRRHV